ncbi:trypsin Inhibitor like cysteine rich domain protein [Ancylostoma caninum]|uniref:Trypsin Inhibitor like cysteine rich domain protein n=1 Tax=Ancylostoma caninum TaxID=29170 RepID=A0A368H0R8_ANCCA|nr:trypsin Inhibitor like cysteine rich domain protein [Ancylostoma caninum]
MKELYLVLLTFYLTAVLAQDERRRCGRNEVFDACGSACEPTCRNPNPEVCTLQCVAGCRCRTGYFRNDNNECVKNCNPPTRPPPTHPPTAASCSEMRCPAGYHCEMVEFPCIRQPCAAPSPRCVPDRAFPSLWFFIFPSDLSVSYSPKGVYCELIV